MLAGLEVEAGGASQTMARGVPSRCRLPGTTGHWVGEAPNDTQSKIHSQANGLDCKTIQLASAAAFTLMYSLLSSFPSLLKLLCA